MFVNADIIDAIRAFRSSFPKRSLVPDSAHPKMQSKQTTAPEALRDMHEHILEYLGFEDKPGRFQPSFEQSVDEAAPRAMIADATSMIITNEGHLLGGWLNVEAAIAACEVLERIVINTKDEVTLSS